MPWDAFITYKSEDRPWAKRLYEELTALGLEVFYDKEKLELGQAWKPQLEAALADSGALVVLWSKAAAQKYAWNEQEQLWFEQPDLQTSRPGSGPKRPVTYLTLDQIPPALGAMHHLTELMDFGSADAVPDKVWHSVAQKTRDAVRVGAGQVRVKTLVLAARAGDLTKDELGRARWDQLQACLKAVGLGQDFDQRYGADPRSWRPYGKRNIDQLLEESKQQLLQQGGPSLYFEAIDHEFEQGADLDAKARQLARKLALIVVDPLSLFDARVEQKMTALRARVGATSNAMAILAPVAADDSLLNDVIRQQALEIFRAFYRPDIAVPTEQPFVGVHLRNADELLRVLLLAVAARSPRAVVDRGSGHPMLDIG